MCSGFPLTNHLALPGSESVFGISQGPPLCACTSLSQHGLVWGGAPSLFDLQGAFLHMCSRGGLLDFENEEFVVFYLLSGQGPAPSIILLLRSFCYYGVSVHRGETVQPGAHLSPASVKSNILIYKI